MVQRVDNAKVTLDCKTLIEIGVGLIAYIGFHSKDTVNDMEWVIKKLLSIYVWHADDGTHWRKDVKMVEGSIILIPQSGLIAECDFQDEPDNSSVMLDDQIESLFQQLIGKAKSLYVPERVNGFFYPHKNIKIEFLNNGPITFVLDSFHRKE